MPRKNRRSKFDPYIDEIEKWLDMGLTIKQIAEELEINFDDVVDESALYSFVRSRNLKSKVFPGGKNREYQPPRCEDCEECYYIIGTNNQKMKTCRSEQRVVPKSVKTSPPWCKERQAERQAV